MSQGGFLSLRAALLEPERVRALVLIDTQAGVEDPERLPAYRQMQQTWLEVGPVDELAQAIAGLILGDPALNEQWIAKWRALPREAMKAPGDCLFERDDITDRLGEIACPALVIHGTADMSIEMELAEKLCSGLSGCHGGRAHRGRPARLEPDASGRGERGAAGVPALAARDRRRAGARPPGTFRFGSSAAARSSKLGFASGRIGPVGERALEHARRATRRASPRSGRGRRRAGARRA